MKSIFLVMSIMLLTPIASFSAPVSEDVHEQNCKDLYELAEAVMDARQNGAPLMAMLNDADKHEKDLEKRKIVKAVVIDAFKESKFSTEEYQKEQTNEFAKKYYLACMEMYS